MKCERPIKIRRYVWVRGKDEYRERTKEELIKVAQRAVDRREANEIAKRVLANREMWLGQQKTRTRVIDVKFPADDEE